MTRDAIRVTTLDPADWPELVGVLAASFNVAPEGWDLFRERVGTDGMFAAHDGERVVGGFGVYRMGQVWMGRTVPLGGIAGVGVAPDRRGQGVARAMMEHALRRLAEERIPVAGLYPATQHVYRKTGYEQAGERVQYEVPLATLDGFRAEVPITPVDPTTPEGMAALKARYQPAHGNLRRSAAIWGRVAGRPLSGVRRAWLLGDDGYVVVQNVPEGVPHWDLDVIDLSAPSAPTARTLLAFLGGHRSMAKNARWYGSPAEPLLAFLHERTWSVTHHQRWMLRIVDVAAALTQRGWADGAEGELGLEVRDALLSENDGRFRLVVRDGRAEVTRGGEGGLRLDVSALGPLYSGLFSASGLRALGWIEGDAAAIRVADRLFAAPIPWMRELY